MSDNVLSSQSLVLNINDPVSTVNIHVLHPEYRNWIPQRKFDISKYRATRRKGQRGFLCSLHCKQFNTFAESHFYISYYRPSIKVLDVGETTQWKAYDIMSAMSQRYGTNEHRSKLINKVKDLTGRSVEWEELKDNIVFFGIPYPFEMLKTEEKRITEQLGLEYCTKRSDEPDVKRPGFVYIVCILQSYVDKLNSVTDELEDLKQQLETAEKEIEYLKSENFELRRYVF